MPLMDHVAIITHNALAAATPNKLKAGNPLEFFALIAFPPAAGAELQALAQHAAGAAPLGNFEIGVTTNAQKGAKQLPGIPGDWFVVRAATQFAPYIADATGKQLDQNNPAEASIIKTAFFAGKRVRAALSAFAWNFKGKTGISFNLNGVMDAGEDSERLNIGVGVVANAFAGYGNPNAQPLTGTAVHTETVTPAQAGSPFGAQGGTANTGAPAATGANPFAQGQAANTSSNPFGTAA